MPSKKYPADGPQCKTCAYEHLEINEQPCRDCLDKPWKMNWEPKPKGANEEKPTRPA